MKRIALAALLLVPALTARAFESVSAARQPAQIAALEGRNLERQVIDCVEKVVPACVFVGGGSGVVIQADGLMLTNYHVVRSSKRWKVRLGREKFFRNAVVVGYDPVGDVSLLKIECKGRLPYVEFGDSDELEVGTYVVAIGNPFALADMAGQPTVSFGIVSAVKSYQENYFDAIWTDAAVNPGNSGGPLLTLDGRLVGINGRIEPRFMTRSNTGIGYAISTKQIERFLPFLREAGGKAVLHGTVQGLALEEPEPGADQIEWQNKNLTSPAVVKAVKGGSTAANAGFRPGDRVVAIDGYETFNRARFSSVLGAYPAGHDVTFTVRRAEGASGPRREGRGAVRLKLTLDSQKNLGLGCKAIMRRANLRGVGRVTGLLVVAVPKGCAAEKAGLKRGDFIVAIDGRKLEDTLVIGAILGELIEKHEVGDQVRLTVRRPPRGEEVEIELPLSRAFD